MPAKAFSSELHDVRLLSLHGYLHISWAIEIYCRALVFLEYISVFAVTAAGGFAFTASHLEKPQVTKGSCPAIRCLAQARHALTPALLRGPAAIGHPWPGAATAASLPRCPLRNTCVRPLGKGQADQDQKPKQRQRQRQDQQLREQARSHTARTQWIGVRLRFSPLNRPSVSSPAAVDLDAPPHREAEWRFCVVGNPAWMPG